MSPNQLKTIARQVRRNLPTSRWEEIPDPRGERGRRYLLSELLQTLLVGMVVGAKTLRDVEALLTDISNRMALGIRGTPSDTTLDRIVRALSPESLQPLIAKQVRDMHRSKQLGTDPELGISLVAIDGKVLAKDRERGHPEAQAQGASGGGLYLLRALRAVHTSSAVKPILGQRIIPAGTNESATLVAFVEDLSREYGRTGLLECFTLDAGFTCAEELRKLNEAGYGFIASLKANQPKLLEGAHRFLGVGDEKPPGGWEVVTETVDSGRRVVRFFARTAELDRWHASWPFTRQVWRICQKTTHAGKVTWEDRYFLTNLPWNRLTPAQAVRAVVAHWGIENNANWTMDVCWGEDRHAWARTGTSLETLAILRILAFNFTRLLRQRSLRVSVRDPIPYRRLFELVRMALVLPRTALTAPFG